MNVTCRSRLVPWDSRKGPHFAREITSGAIGRLLLNSRLPRATEFVASNQSGSDGKEGAHPHRRWHRRDGIVSPVLIWPLTTRAKTCYTSLAGSACSTIAYDTLVRAGIECTSANVQSGGSPYGSVGTSPALVVCSRGIKILPDTTLQPLEAGPVHLHPMFCDACPPADHKARIGMMRSSSRADSRVPRRSLSQQRCRPS